MYKNLNSQEFQREINGNNKATLLDVRTPEEYQSGKIPGAINIDVMDEGFRAAVEQLDKQQAYYVYCRSGGRSGHACNFMAKQGFKVVNLAGGISNWQGEVI